MSIHSNSFLRQFVILVVAISFCSATAFAGKPPYPIIFVHGLNSDPSIWNSSIRAQLDSYGWVLGQRIKVSLDYSTSTMHDPKEEDVHVFADGVGSADYYYVEFGVDRSGNSYLIPPNTVLQDPIDPGQTQITVQDASCIQPQDILAVGDNGGTWELMRCLSKQGNSLTVARQLNNGGVSSGPGFSFSIVSVWNTSYESNQSSIVNQGHALAQVVQLVKSINESEKVILVGHSMGGLAAREYIQAQSYDHDVAKVVSIGSPHLGSNADDWGFGVFASIDGRSPAVRDLRYATHAVGSRAPFGSPPDDGIFLFGGEESFVYPALAFYNYDYNGDGIEGNGEIIGLNYRQFPVDYFASSIVGIAVGGWPFDRSDGIVREDRQFYHYFNQPLITDTLQTPLWHTTKGAPWNWVGEYEDVQSFVRGLDEPGISSLAYALNINDPADPSDRYDFFTTYQSGMGEFDDDWFQFETLGEGVCTIRIVDAHANALSAFIMIYDENGDPVVPPISPTPPTTVIQFNTPSANHHYWVDYQAQANSTSFNSPNHIRIEHVLTPDNLATLSNGYVSPPTGCDNTNFEFWVTYTDQDGDPPFPNSIKAVVDGTELNMFASGSDWPIGQPFRTVSNTLVFNAGPHNYHFIGTQGSNQLRWPASGERQFTLTGSSPTPISVMANPTQIYVNGTSTITVSVMNAACNPQANVPISLSSSVFGTFTPEQGVSNANGQFVSQYFASTPGTNRITARRTDSTPNPFAQTDIQVLANPSTYSVECRVHHIQHTSDAAIATIYGRVTDELGDPQYPYPMTFTTTLGTFANGQNTFTGTTNVAGEVFATFTTYTEGWANVHVTCLGAHCDCSAYLMPGLVPPISPIFTGLGFLGEVDHDREIAWNPDGTVLSGAYSTYPRAYDIPQFTVRNLSSPGTSGVPFISASPISDDILESGISGPHRIAAVNARTNTNYRAHQLSTSFHPWVCTWSGGGSWVAVANFESGFKNQIGIHASGDLTGPVTTLTSGSNTYEFNCLEWRGNYLIAGHRPEVACWTVNESNGSASLLWTNSSLNGNIGRTSIRISPDLTKVAVLSRTSSSSYFNVHVLRMSDGADILHVRLPGETPNSVDWSPDGTMLVVVGDLGHILDANTLAELYQLSGITANTPSVAWSSRNLIATQNAVWAPFDYSGPVITWAIPTNWATTLLDSIRCQGTIYDTVGLSSSSPPQYQVNGGAMVNITVNSDWTFDFWAHFASDTSSIRIVATDRVGNAAEITRWVVRQHTPVIILSKPNGGENFVVGQRDTIHWTAAYLTGTAQIILNRNWPSGAWETLVSEYPLNNNIWFWDPVTQPASTACRVAVISETFPTSSDTSNTNFTIALPPVPVVSDFAINNGESSTTSQIVTLNHHATNSPSQYIASEAPDFTGATWLTYINPPIFSLSAGGGTKIVYLKLRNASGESNVSVDQIEFVAPPDPVDDLIILAASNHEDIELHWSPAIGAASYVVYADSSSGFVASPLTFLGTTTDTSYVDIGRALYAQRQYYIVVSSSEPSLVDSGLVAFYPLDGNALDESGHSLDGIIGGAVPTEDRFGRQNGAFDFDGANDYIEVPDNDLLDIGANESVTVCMWIRTTLLSNWSSASKYRYATPSGGVLLSGNAGYAIFDGRDRAGAYRASGLSTTFIADNQWHFLAGMRSGTIWSIWVDGIVENSQDSHSTQAMDNSCSLLIGCATSDNYCTNHAAHFLGQIDDVRMYDRSLSAGEIQTLFEQVFP